MKYYCIASCDKCRLARKILREKNILHVEVDFRKADFTSEVLASWIKNYGVEVILNRNSATWRGLDEAQKAMIETMPIDIIMSNPAMLFRPILDFGDELKIGKNAILWLESA